MLDLFSGIGGFSLGLSWAGEFETSAFCEIDPYCQKVLRKHWPDVPIYDDIKALTNERLRADGIVGIDVVTGGFPCQGFSFAGKRRGKEDDRYLWPEMLRVIAEVKPAWVIGENVPGIISLALDTVLSDLEGQGYTCQTFVIPACGVDAPHKRNRVWVIAHDNCYRRRIQQESWSQCQSQTDTYYNGQEEPMGNANSQRCEESNFSSLQTGRIRIESSFRREIESRICRVSHGIPNRMDRIRALGNAVVPQIPMMLGHFILRAMAGGDA